MESKIRSLINRMDALEKSLHEEYRRLAKKYGFSIRERRVVFLQKIRERNRTFRIPVWRYAVPKNIRHILSMPFIYGMIVPVVILDVFLTVYNMTALPLYRIPRVRRRDYIVFDRRFLDYLNVVQKVHCLYCSYVNGLFAYAVEIGARTERYWCPLKAADDPKAHHGWYKDFADYGNPEEWKEKFNDHDAFKEIGDGK